MTVYITYCFCSSRPNTGSNVQFTGETFTGVYRGLQPPLNDASAQMKDCIELRNLDDIAVGSRRMLQTGLRNLAKFSTENCGP